MSSLDESETLGNVKKTFKSKSLNSLFRRTVSPEVETSTSSSGSTNSTNTTNVTPTMGAIGGGISSSATVGSTASLNRSPWDSPREKSPALAHASLSKAGPGGTGGTGVIKLTAIKKDLPASPSASPGSEHANIWMKSAQSKPEDHKAHHSKVSEGPVLKAPTQTQAAAQEPHEDQAQKLKEKEPVKTPKIFHKRTMSEFSEEELEKRGINVLHVPQQSSSGFNWDDDDDDPNWAAAQLSTIAPSGVPSNITVEASPPVNSIPLTSISGSSKQQATASAKPEVTAAPWSNITAKEPKGFVSIDQQFKELAEKKQAEQMRLQQRRQRMAPGYGRRDGHNGGSDRWGPPGGDERDRFGRGGHNQHGYSRFDDPEDDRFRFQDHDRRYRSFESPRQELYSPRSRQFEPLDHEGGPMGNDRFGNGRFGGPPGRRPSLDNEPEHIANKSGSSLNPYGPPMHGHTVVFKPKERTKEMDKGPDEEINHEQQGQKKPVTAPREKEPSVQKSPQRMPQRELEPSERPTPTEPPKTAEQIRQEQKERMHAAAEAARKRKEDEMRKDQERIEAAKKKADEIAKVIAERKRKQEEAEAEEAAKQKARYVAPSRRLSSSHDVRVPVGPRPRSHTSGSSIDDTQTIRAIDSIINGDNETESGSKTVNNKKTLWKAPVNPVGAAEAKVVWNRNGSNSQQPNASNGLWPNVGNKNLDKKSVQTSNGDVDADWKLAKEERLDKFKNSPTTKRASSFESPPGGRGHSRFFPSPQLDASAGPAGSPIVGRAVGLNGPEALWSLQSSEPSTQAKAPRSQDKTKNRVPRVVLPPLSQSGTTGGGDSRSNMPIPINPEVTSLVHDEHQENIDSKASNGSKANSKSSSTGADNRNKAVVKLPYVNTKGFTSSENGIDDLSELVGSASASDIKVHVSVSGEGEDEVSSGLKSDDIKKLSYPIGQVTLPDLTAASSSYYRDSTGYMHRREFETSSQDKLPSYMMLRIANIVKTELSLVNGSERKDSRSLGDSNWRSPARSSPHTGRGAFFSHPRGSYSRSNGTDGGMSQSSYHNTPSKDRSYGTKTFTPRVQ